MVEDDARGGGGNGSSGRGVLGPGSEAGAAAGDGSALVADVVRLWLDGRRLPADEVRVELDEAGRWRVRGRLAAEDPFLRTYGVSAQFADGRTLHGRARLVAADDGWIELEGLGPPSGAVLRNG